MVKNRTIETVNCSLEPGIQGNNGGSQGAFIIIKRVLPDIWKAVNIIISDIWPAKSSKLFVSYDARLNYLFLYKKHSCL
ncbi:MAG: hypothetical protein B0W54_05275 [Cellvibrio sp. 79]|nr:MAG: hypothetical protein B0W54_05275 [Cellvibrio sp. 79]